MPTPRRAVRACGALVSSALGLSSPAFAQTAPAPAPAASAAAPAPAPSPAPASNTPPAAGQQRIEITGGRSNDTEERRRATASKIVIGREEIDKFGDATIGEVLRRLPGVTTPGAPGRGGPPRMRGLGGGFTQLLIDGQRLPPGFSLESLTPEQVERIEILRAPTAETGARAIAGTINIITREGFRRRLNDLRIGFGVENGRVSPGLQWTHNDTAGELTYNLSGSLFRGNRKDQNRSTTSVTDAATGAPLELRNGSSESFGQRTGLNLTARLQWRLNDSGDNLVLMPSIFTTEADNDARFRLDQPLRRPTTPVFYDTGQSVTESAFTAGRLGVMGRFRAGPVRLELNSGLNGSKGRSETARQDLENGVQIRSSEDRSRSRETAGNATLKGTLLAGGNPGQPAGEHTLVAGLELEGSQRSETRTALLNGQNQLADFGDDLEARQRRIAAYAQDEWQINPNWGAYAGLRWEGIQTRGDTGQGDRPTNRSSVATPLLHAVYKPDPKGRDQLRISLTRSYRSPGLAALIGKPRINPDYPVTGTNLQNFPDSAGNPNLKPELATGVDIAIERYLESGGILSANLFHRQISNLIRGRAELESVSWSAFPRWVFRQRNIGDATTSGIELEAKFRLDQLITGAPAVELRNNLSLYTSQVKDVPGPDNRLDQQSRLTANFGADYRFRGTPFTAGGNVNLVPGYRTRLDVDQSTEVSRKRVWDAYVLWAVNPGLGIRLLANNIAPADYTTVNVTDAQVGNVAERTTSTSTGPSFTNWQLRFEFKL
jgi:iron complex outermembrane receptor protein